MTLHFNSEFQTWSRNPKSLTMPFAFRVYCYILYCTHSFNIIYPVTLPFVDICHQQTGAIVHILRRWSTSFAARSLAILALDYPRGSDLELFGALAKPSWIIAKSGTSVGHFFLCSCQNSLSSCNHLHQITNYESSALMPTHTSFKFSKIYRC